MSISCAIPGARLICGTYRVIRAGWWGGILFPLAIAFVGTVSGQEVDRTGDYLKELGLVGLELERELESLETETNVIRRRDQAERWVRSYAQAVLSGRSGTQSLPDRSRVRQVLDEFPEFTNSDIRLALLKSKVDARTFDVAQAWIQTLDKGDLPELTRDLRDDLNEVDTLRQQIEKAWQDRAWSDSDFETGVAGPVGTQLFHLKRFETDLTLRLSMIDSERRKEWAMRAVDSASAMHPSRNGASLTDRARETDWLVPWQAEMALVWAVAAQLLDRREEASQLFYLVRTQGQTHRALTESQCAVWEFTARAVTEAPEKLGPLLEAALSQTTTRESQVKLCDLSLEAATALHSSNEPAAVALALPACRWLLGLDQPILLKPRRESMEKWLNLDADLLSWFETALAWQRFRSTRDQTELRDAYRRIRAVNPGRQQRDLSESQRCAFQLLLARVALEVDEQSDAVYWTDAIRQNSDTLTVIQAEEVAWIRFRALSGLARIGQGKIDSAWAAMSEFEEKYPNSRYSERLALEKYTLIRNQLDPEEGLAYLGRLDAATRQRWPIRRLVAQEMARAWEQALQGGAEDNREVATRFLRELESLEKDSAMPAEVKVELLCTLQRLRIRYPSLMESGGWDETWNKIESYRTNLPTNSPAKLQSVLVDMEFSQVKGLTDRATDAASYLVRHATERPLLINAWITLAQDAERRLAADSSESRESLQKAIEVYRQLLEVYDEAAMSENRNMQAAALKLAGHQLTAGQLDDAAAMIARLQQACPQEPRVQLLNAQVLARKARWQEALDVFGRVSASTAVASDLWLEAKLGQVRCLVQTDPPQARQVVRQVHQFVPELGETWREQFDEAIQ